jgi:Phytanoyl-CoA dioxygenase (PhyH)
MDGERFVPLDFDHFHLDTLPAALERCGPVFSDADTGVVRPLAFKLRDGESFTYVPTGHTFAIQRGSALAHTIVELTPAMWGAFVWELKSSFALLYADEISVVKGDFGQLARWEPSLRVAFDGQVLYDIDDPPAVNDADGRPIDLRRSFTLGDPDDEIIDFLRRAGFVHLRGVMTQDEIDALCADVSAAVARAKPDDRRSWWTRVDGQDVCCRVNYLNEQSTRIAGLGADERFVRIATFGGAELRDAPDRLDGNGVVIKVPGASDGLVDLPWHRDCGMGGHPVKCPMLNVGIQLDAANAAAGQLLMIAGSHRGTSRLPGPRHTGTLPVVALTTEPGDVTVHFGHTLHAAPAPTGAAAAGRRALYLSFVPPLTFEMVGPGQGYNDVLFTRDAGHVRHADALR